MRYIIRLVVALAPLASFAFAKTTENPAVVYEKRQAAGVTLHVIQADVSRRDVNLGMVTAQGGIGKLESWSSMIHRAKPVAAITGTYFDTVSLKPIGSMGMGGKSLYEGFVGTAFMYNPFTGPTIQFAKPQRTFKFGNADMWLRAGPRLLTEGKTTLYPKQEGFRDPAVFQKKPRTAIAINEAGKLLMIAVKQPVYLSQLAAALKGIGAADAMCLDGGSSAGLYHEGTTVLKPQRQLTNLLVVYDSTEAYQANLKLFSA